LVTLGNIEAHGTLALGKNYTPLYKETIYRLVVCALDFLRIASAENCFFSLFSPPDVLRAVSMYASEKSGTSTPNKNSKENCKRLNLKIYERVQAFREKRDFDSNNVGKAHLQSAFAEMLIYYTLYSYSCIKI
jgi:hypothetical protein